MTVEFEINGQPFTALNGSPLFKFNEAVSLQVYCETQDEVDQYWGKLAEGGDEVGGDVRAELALKRVQPARDPPFQLVRAGPGRQVPSN